MPAAIVDRPLEDSEEDEVDDERIDAKKETRTVGGGKTMKTKPKAFSCQHKMP